MGDRDAKNALYDALAEVPAALANGRRVEVLDLLAQGERSVEEIAREIGQSVANTSHHLRTLARAGLVATRREGTRVYYRVASAAVLDLWRSVRAVAWEHVADVERRAEEYLGDRDAIDAVSRDELARRLGRSRIVILDVRPRAEYDAGHIPGARWIDPANPARHLRDLPARTNVVAYCRGPFCVFADDAIRSLRRRGVHARRLEDGFPEWRDAGLPVAGGDRNRRKEPA